MKISVAQWTALALLGDHERRLGHHLEPGDAGVYSQTWQDSYTTGIHWRTAEALASRGLVTIEPPEDPEFADLFLTDAGRELLAERRRRTGGGNLG